MLWLALYLPQLPLESVANGQDDGRPQLVYETRGSQQTVHRLNAAAAQTGIETGMPLTAARSLCNKLMATERNPDHEQKTMHSLALWAMQFTSKVSLEPPCGLILEIGASLNLFGGLDNICDDIQSGLHTLGYQAYTGIAPVAAAAWLLALNRQAQVVLQRAELNTALRQLALTLLPLDPEKKTALHRLGLQCIGDCLRLPRDGLSRRLGPELVNYLDHALGRVPDPRQCISAPDHFQAQILLPEPVDQVQPLLFILQRLLRQLCGYLRARDSGAQRVRLGLIIPFQSIQWLHLTLLQPSRDPEHLFRLWQEKLERVELSAAVEGLELQVRQLLPLEPAAPDLLGTPRKSTLAFMQTLERLKSRLGEGIIRQPFCSADHRPELSGRLAAFPAPAHGFETLADRQRPLWLLPKPMPLEHTADGGPCLQGPLTLLSTPERIEAGWWDSRDRRRDYYIARSMRCQWLWIYRELGIEPGWYLHGFFS
jgi:protein ImuB